MSKEADPQNLRIALHRIRHAAENGMAHCEEEGADHYKETDENTRWYEDLSNIYRIATAALKARK